MLLSTVSTINPEDEQTSKGVTGVALRIEKNSVCGMGGGGYQNARRAMIRRGASAFRSDWNVDWNIDIVAGERRSKIFAWNVINSAILFRLIFMSVCHWVKTSCTDCVTLPLCLGATQQWEMQGERWVLPAAIRCSVPSYTHCSRSRWGSRGWPGGGKLHVYLASSRRDPKPGMWPLGHGASS